MPAIKIFVKPYVKKFLKATYGKTEPIQVRGDDDLGVLFRLGIGADVRLSDAEFEDEDELYTSMDKKRVKLNFFLTFRVAHGRMTVEQKQKITKAMESEFYKAMYFYCKGVREYPAIRISERQAVVTFLNSYGIKQEDGITEDAAIKATQRERQRKEAKNL